MVTEFSNPIIDKKKILPRLIKNMARALVLLILGWLTGLILFVWLEIPDVNPSIPLELGANWQEIESLSAKGELPIQAVIVLTGGSLRIEAGLYALEHGFGERLFISGVYHGTDVEKLLDIANREPAHLANKIELGHIAEDTIGNALEIAAWTKANHITKAILITGAYHMPRSLLEINFRTQDLSLITVPVFPEHVKLANWFLNRGTLWLLISEYQKYMFSRMKMFVTTQFF